MYGKKDNTWWFFIGLLVLSQIEIPVLGNNAWNAYLEKAVELCLKSSTSQHTDGLRDVSSVSILRQIVIFSLLGMNHLTKRNTFMILYKYQS